MHFKNYRKLGCQKVTLYDEWKDESDSYKISFLFKIFQYR